MGSNGNNRDAEYLKELDRRKALLRLKRADKKDTKTKGGDDKKRDRRRG